MEEVWKDIKGYEGQYQVSDMGNVKSLNYKRLGKEQILKPYLNTNGYYYVNLCRNGKPKMTYIHRIVAEAFIPNPQDKREVNHISTVRTENHVSNLEWTTHKENQNNLLTRENMKRNASQKGKYGKQSIKSKVIVQFKTNDEFVKRWDCAKDVERQLNINATGISMCCNGKKNHSTAGGYIWRFLSDMLMLKTLPVVGRLSA